MPAPTFGTITHLWTPKLLAEKPAKVSMNCRRCEDFEECRGLVADDLPVNCEIPDELDAWKMMQKLVEGGTMKDLVYWLDHRGCYHRPGKIDDHRNHPLMTKCGSLYMSLDFGRTLRDGLESSSSFEAIQRGIKPCLTCFPFSSIRFPKKMEVKS